MSLKRKKRRIIISGAALLLTVVIAFSGVCFYLALQDTGLSDPGEAEDGFLTTILKGSLFGDEFELPQTQLNTFINEKYCTPYSDTGSGILQIRVGFHEKKSPELFAKIYTHGKKLSVQTCFDISSHGDGEITLKLHDFSSGRLKIPDALLSAVLPHILRGGKNYTVDGSCIRVHAKYSYKLKNSSVELMLTELNPCDGYVLCRTNSLTTEALRAVGDYLSSKEFRQKVSDRLSDLADKWFD